MNKVIECVPNFSEGRDLEKVEKIADVFRGKNDIKLLDYSSDADHNRSVLTVAGEPQAMKIAIVDAIEMAIQLIDMNNHSGQHPRMGAVDVVPFIPIRNITMDEAVSLSKEIAQEVGERLNIPVFLYEKSTSVSYRNNLSDIRKGQYEGLSRKMSQPEWTPDYGPGSPHPTAGAVAIGARNPLIAYNVNLGTNNIDIANDIAKRVRHIGGGLRYCKAIGIKLDKRNISQVSMNLTDFTRTSIYQAHEMVRMEAKRYGVEVIGAEVIGLIPMQALADSAAYYLGIENFSMEQVLETKLME